MVSFLVTMIMMMVITLIVVGFTQVVNQNRRDALDRQLSTEAYYAAESGVNDALARINEKLVADPAATLPTAADCTGGNSFASQYGAYTPIAPGVSYSCLLVDPVNSSLEYSDIKTNMPTVIMLKPVTRDGVPTTIDTVKISWSAKTGASDFSGCTTTAYKWLANMSTCDFGVLRTEVFKPTIGDITAGNGFSMYAIPKIPATGTSVPFQSGKSFSQPVACTTTPIQICSYTVSGLSAAPELYLRANMIYAEAQKLIITATNSAGAVYFNGQVKIDSTGKAQDVSRRIQVRVTPQNSPANNPVAAVMGNNKICKRFAVGPITYQDRATYCTSEVDDPEPFATPGGCSPGEPGCPGDPPGGGGTPDPDGIYWRRMFRNLSPNDPSQVASCTWDWGDGSAPGRTACLQNETIPHTFAHPYRGLECYTATITLTIRLTNSKTKVGTMTQKVPFGLGAAEHCGNRWPPAPI